MSTMQIVTQSKAKAALRTAAHRRRRKQGYVAVTVEVHSRHLETLVRLEHLGRDELNDRAMVAAAVMNYLDEKLWDEAQRLAR